MIAGSDHYLNVPAEATAFLGAVAGFVVLLLVFFLYLNKKWCFGTTVMPCCDEQLASTQATSHHLHPTGASHSHILSKAYSLDSPESSSDSELEIARRLQQNIRPSQHLHHVQIRSPSSIHATTPVHSSALHHLTLNSSSLASQDLMSLVEKGRLGGISSTSSCCSSTNSSIGTGVPHSDHTKMTTHRAIAQDIRETRIDNFGGNVHSGKKYHKLSTESSIESTDLNSNNSNQDCIVVLGQESCYDTDGQSLYAGTTADNELCNDMVKCGEIEIALLYDAPMRKMTVHLLQARDIPSRDRGQPIHTQARILLLPSKKQKHKTKIRSGDNPQYMESFLLHRINPEDVNSMGLRVRVYGCERMRRERLIGECFVNFSSLDLELEATLWLMLEPRAAPQQSSTANSSRADLRSLTRSDSTGSAQSMQHGGVPELLLGLAYNATTGRLSVEIVKGSHFRNLTMNRAPDTYVKLCLVSSNGQEMARSKTSVRRGQPNPLFKETFIFQVALFQLADVTLMVSIYNRKGVTKRKEMIGWFSLGLNSSGPEQLAHWNDMKDLHAQQLCRWHVLNDS